MPGPREHFNPREKIPQPENLDTIEEVSIESAPELEELAEKRSNDLEVEAANLENDGQKRIENAITAIGLTQEKIDQNKEIPKLRSKLERIFQKGKELARDAKEKILEIIASEEFGEIVEAMPFAGGVKKMSESISGQKLSGEKLKGLKRLTRGIKGATDVVTDFIETKKVEKGGRLSYVGKKTAEGVRTNPETMAKLGKKILGSKKENINDIGK